MREFSPALLEPFGLRSKRITRAYGAFICDTNQGVVLVKAAAQPEEALWAAHGAKEYLCRQGFGWTDRYLVSRDGVPWAVASGETYTVRSWLRAEEADLTDKNCVIQMAAMLGRMHRLSVRYELVQGAQMANRCYEWPQKVYKNCRKLKSYGKILRKNGHYTEFDLMVLSCLPKQVEEAEEAQEFFMGPQYVRLAEQAQEQHAFGHGQYTDHTVLLGKNRTMITDFEKISYMIPATDLVMLLEKVMRKNHWSVEFGMEMLEAYDRWCPTGDEERQFIYAGLLYPSRLCELCTKAYHMKRSWIPIAYKQKLEEFLAQQEKRKDFLLQLRSVLR